MRRRISWNLIAAVLLIGAVDLARAPHSRPARRPTSIAPSPPCWRAAASTATADRSPRGARPGESSGCAKGGKSGPALVAGKPDESLLWQRIESGEMPPKQPLGDAEKKILRDWIAGGRRWGTDPIDPFRFTTGRRAGYDWWSLQPVRPVELPSVPRPAWPRNPVDRFVLARLGDEGAEAVAEADRRTLDPPAVAST